MNVEKLYSKANKEFEAKNYNAALKLLDKIKKYAPNNKDALWLEARIEFHSNNSVKAFYALKKILPLLEYSSTEGRHFASRILSLIGGVCGDLGLIEEALKFHLLSASISDNKEFSLLSINNAIFAADCLENFSAEDFQNLYNEYKKYLSQIDIQPFARKIYHHEKIRVGFISVDFYNNAMVYWAWSLLTKLDKKFFKIYFYSQQRNQDNVTNYLRSIADGWHDIFDLNDKSAAQVIRDDEIDILFDLSGHVPINRLRVAAYRPASVQICGIGYMNSTGLDCFDYFLSDVYCAGDENFFTEKLIKLPHSHICYEPTTKLEPAESPPCIKNNFVTFGSFNKFSKITDTMLLAWKKILDAVPNSRLILKYTIFNTDDGKNFVGERMKILGFDLARIEMRGFSKTWLAEYGDVDIALDTFPYTGGVTTCEALYMGVPVVSLYGARHGSRFGLSILKNIGLDELAVDSYDKYINRAVALAGDWELLTILRKNLRTMMKNSPLMNSENYLHEIQEAFIKILNERRTANER